MVELFYFAFPHKGCRLLATAIQSFILVEAPMAHKKLASCLESEAQK
jgi:hypothetical protein